VSSRPFRVGRWLRGDGQDIAGSVYGEILVLSVIAAAANQTAGRAAVFVVVTTTVFWLAHVYAHALGHSVARGRRVDWPEVKSIAIRESAMLQASVPPTLVLLLGAFGVLTDDVAQWLAMVTGLVMLTTQAVLYARIERLGIRGTVLSVGINLAFGLAIVVLKVFVSH
jgi:hypothetical protein